MMPQWNQNSNDIYALFWGTYGKGGVEHCNGRCPEHHLRWVRLVDCDTEHLLAILRTQPQIPTNYVAAIQRILRERKFPMESNQKEENTTMDTNKSVQNQKVFVTLESVLLFQDKIREAEKRFDESREKWQALKDDDGRKSGALATMSENRAVLGAMLRLVDTLQLPISYNRRSI